MDIWNVPFVGQLNFVHISSLFPQFKHIHMVFHWYTRFLMHGTNRLYIQTIFPWDSFVSITAFYLKNQHLVESFVLYAVGFSISLCVYWWGDLILVSVTEMFAMVLKAILHFTELPYTLYQSLHQSLWWRLTALVHHWHYPLLGKKGVRHSHAPLHQLSDETERWKCLMNKVSKIPLAGMDDHHRLYWPAVSSLTGLKLLVETTSRSLLWKSLVISEAKIYGENTTLDLSLAVARCWRILCLQGWKPF